MTMAIFKILVLVIWADVLENWIKNPTISPVLPISSCYHLYGEPQYIGISLFPPYVVVLCENPLWWMMFVKAATREVEGCAENS